MKLPSQKNILFMLIFGVVATFVWSFLFGAWAAVEIPILRSAYGLGLNPNFLSELLTSLFSLVSAGLFVFPLWIFMRDTFMVSAAIFLAGFLAMFFVPVVLVGQAQILEALFNLTALWLFVIAFLLWVLLAARFLKAQED